MCVCARECSLSCHVIFIMSYSFMTQLVFLLCTIDLPAEPPARRVKILYFPFEILFSPVIFSNIRYFLWRAMRHFSPRIWREPHRRASAAAPAAAVATLKWYERHINLYVFCYIENIEDSSSHMIAAHQLYYFLVSTRQGLATCV